MGSDWPLFLGGSARPLGCWVTFVDRPYEMFLEALMGFHAETADHTFVLTDPEPVGAALRHLDPMESPWTVEMVVDCSFGIAYVNNKIGGGDPTAHAPVVARRLDARAIQAEHMPKYGPGHAATQLWIQGPDGEPPLMYERTLSAYATDGRWAWKESGTVQAWERPDRYEARLKRDRLDRALLVDYLGKMGIFVDQPEFFGAARAIRAQVPWTHRIRRETVGEFHTASGWG